MTSIIALKHNLWALLGRYCSALPLFSLYKAVTGKRFDVVGKDTQIVIEGYPRSANTMAVAAFELAQHGPVKIAHHVHGPAQVLWAVKHQIPAIVLIRNPRDAVASLVVRYPGLSLKWALKNYINFYEAIEPVKRHCVIAEFDRVVSRFGDLIAAVNDRYATNFVKFVVSDANMSSCFSRIDELDKMDRGSQHATDTTVARPNDSRDKLTEQVKQELASVHLRDYLARANHVYERITK